MIYGNEGCGRETHTALGCASCCMGLETTARVPVNHVLNDRNAHYVFYCDLFRSHGQERLATWRRISACDCNAHALIDRRCSNLIGVLLCNKRYVTVFI